MTTLNVRIDEKLKKQASKTLESLGFDMSGAIKVFLTQVVQDQALPFQPAKDSKKIRAQWDREVAQAIKSGKGFSSAKDLMIDMLGKKEYARLSK
jgi:DNA-damage-inducible protein J